MAEIVLGIGSSHSPMLTLDSHDWIHRSEDDLTSNSLNLSDGRFVSYAQLISEFGENYKEECTPERLKVLEELCEASLNKLADELEISRPDAVVIIGDDQDELFEPGSQPALALYYGDEVLMHDHWGDQSNPDWVKRMAKGYAMDDTHRFPTHQELAGEMIEAFIQNDIDISVQKNVNYPAQGFGHAFGFIIRRLFRGKTYPVVPVLLNTYFPPNVIKPSRALHIGRQIARSLESCTTANRVAVIASGGLSHFVVDTKLDKKVLDGMKPGHANSLQDIPSAALKSGSSEILNWIMLAGCIESLNEIFVDYYPVFRTPGGTGCGLAFGAWSKAGPKEG